MVNFNTTSVLRLPTQETSLTCFLFYEARIVQASVIYYLLLFCCVGQLMGVRDKQLQTHLSAYKLTCNKQLLVCRLMLDVFCL